MPTPMPTQLDDALHSDRMITHHRRLGCDRYRECLDESVRRRWQSFSCLACPLASGVVSETRKRELKACADRRTGDRFGAA